MADRFDKFTERARRVLTLAQDEAVRLGHMFIGPEHLLLGLVREGDGVGARVLANLGVELDKVRAAVESIVSRADYSVSREIGFTPRAKKAIELAVDSARHLNHHYIGTEHLLLGLVREGEGIAAEVLESLGVTLVRVRAETERLLSQSIPASATREPRPAPAASPRQHPATRAENANRAVEARRQTSGFSQRRVPGTESDAHFGAGLALGLAVSDEARSVLELAWEEAAGTGRRVEAFDLLLALTSPGLQSAARLEQHGVDVPRLRATVQAILQNGAAPPDPPSGQQPEPLTGNEGAV